jgi:hypothetical protein
MHQEKATFGNLAYRIFLLESNHTLQQQRCENRNPKPATTDDKPSEPIEQPCALAMAKNIDTSINEMHTFIAAQRVALGLGALLYLCYRYTGLLLQIHLLLFIHSSSSLSSELSTRLRTATTFALRVHVSQNHSPRGTRVNGGIRQ